MNAIVTDLFGAEPAAPKAFKRLGPSGFVPAARVPLEYPPPPKFGERRVVNADSFAGGGGASNGIEAALEVLWVLELLPAWHSRKVDYAVNHNEAALAMHEANHPETVHLPHNVWKVSMREILGDNLFGILWLSPDCRDHSPAKGGPITSRSVRDLAWVLIKWLKELPDWQRPRLIALENVPAFSKWSPLIDHPDGGYQRDEKRLGEVFHRFVKAVAGFGYSVGWTELTACEHGDPTIRRRLQMVMRRDGERTEWPEATHGDPKSSAVASGELEPWPVAADIIDFDRPCPSILMTKEEATAYTRETGIKIIRPLAFKSDARIAKGVKRHVLQAAEPFLVTCNHGGDGFRGQGLDVPLATVTKSRDAHGLVVPSLVAYYGEGHGSKDRSASISEPLRVVPTAPRHALLEAAVAPFISYGQHGGRNRSALDPLHTVKASTKDQNQVVAAALAPFIAQQNGDRKDSGIDYARAGRSAGSPLGAATTSPTQTLAALYLAQHNTGVIGHHMRKPISTIVKEASTQALVSATFIKRDFGNSIGSSMSVPIGALTSGGGGKAEVVAAHMMSLKGSTRRDGSCKKPHAAVCASGQHSAVVTLPLMTAYYSTGGQSAAIDDPMLAVPTKARFGLTEADASKPPLSDAQLGRARMVADFLRRHDCWDEREFVTLTISGETYIVIDIGMRMLTPRELARAQGFPDSYILAAPYKGGTLSETEQRHKIGNSVCKRPAAASIIVNYRPIGAWGEAPGAFLEAAE
ncbi:DNA cytosine methyltransferase [Rhizobium leguminosarum]|uniref:DNA cytosine methyltransferase n=1 Tax=Rhizobium leguminosarum TaxID=384 RepID=UPI0013B8D0D2|nr:DNA cytosine methyltransferase [Rhizobium leguminosarum]NEI60930.1 DNA methyltransferase [Rhizobium leguminosarum]